MKYRINRGARRLWRALRDEAVDGIVSRDALLARRSAEEIDRLVCAGFLTIEEPARMIDETPATSLSEEIDDEN